MGRRLLGVRETARVRDPAFAALTHVETSGETPFDRATTQADRHPDNNSFTATSTVIVIADRWVRMIDAAPSTKP
jgi:hypothetical protein